MLRSLLIIALLASLYYLVTHLQPGAGSVPAPVRDAVSQPDKPAEVVPPVATTRNPPIPAPLPDVTRGYVFSEKRKIEKDEPPPVVAKAVPVVEQGPDPIESVQYSGAIIAGDFVRALVVYQESGQEAPSRRGAPQSGAGARKKQLDLGERFLGYEVAAIEPDRVVFKKENRQVEKFLHDRNKKRPVLVAETQPPSGLPSEIGGVPVSALAPPEVLATLVAPAAQSPQSSPPPRAASAVPAAPGTGSAAGDAAGAQDLAKIQAARLVRRSQRLLGLDPTIDLPLVPVPGLPVPNN